jgi:hypothetical protein
MQAAKIALKLKKHTTQLEQLEKQLLEYKMDLGCELAKTIGVYPFKNNTLFHASVALMTDAKL